ncbi:MAG: DUF4372 domain-containing protein [Anaerohalosphaeraceae bacterium]
MITFGSLFTQVLSLVNRNTFGRAVRQWDAEHGAKGFRCWDQFVAMLFCQLAGADSLAGEEVHGEILATRNSNAAIFKVIDSPWIEKFNPRHLGECSHYQIMFYDEIYDVICKDIKMGRGRIIDKD